MDNTSGNWKLRNTIRRFADRPSCKNDEIYMYDLHKNKAYEAGLPIPSCDSCQIHSARLIRGSLQRQHLPASARADG